MTRRNLAAYRACQVFLNHPFDSDFAPLGEVMAFAVTAGGLLPVNALDLTVPDQPRLSLLVDAIRNCRYSAHDLSRCKGGGDENFARMNMPIEMGMAMFHAFDSQRREHRCAFLVATTHDYKKFASDLAGLDPRCHNNEQGMMVSEVYEWLRSVVPSALFNNQPAASVVDMFRRFRKQRSKLRGAGKNARPSHDEVRELMYQVCSERGWWDWRDNRHGKEEFPVTPLAWRE